MVDIALSSQNSTVLSNVNHRGGKSARGAVIVSQGSRLLPPSGILNGSIEVPLSSGSSLHSNDSDVSVGVIYGFGLILISINSNRYNNI